MPRARILVALSIAALSACNVSGTFGGSSDDPTPSDDDSSSCDGEGALPPPNCGEGACSCCGSCDVSRELCMTTDWSIGFGYGHCYPPRAKGSMAATIGVSPFVATEVAAVSNGSYIHVIGRIETTPDTLRQISIQSVATLGTTDCVATPVIEISYAEGETRISNNAPRLVPRPPCSVTLTSIGAVGERIEGSFSVTLLDRAPQGTVDITGGTFSVERVAYP
jgi:hypothetical protein